MFTSRWASARTGNPAILSANGESGPEALRHRLTTVLPLFDVHSFASVRPHTHPARPQSLPRDRRKFDEPKPQLDARRESAGPACIEQKHYQSIPSRQSRTSASATYLFPGRALLGRQNNDS
jgi:hypothetical protein